jgi:hypothetical protein
MNTKQFSEWLVLKTACADGKEWARGKTLAQAWNNLERPEWMIWLIWQSEEAVEKTIWVKIAVYAAKQALPFFEKQYPKDKRPWKAIEAAERWIKNPTEENRKIAFTSADASVYVSASAAAHASAAESASASAAADASAYAYAAVYADADAAEDAAEDAAAAASAAAYAAAAAAIDASEYARKKMNQKICVYIRQLIKLEDLEF